MANPAAPPFPEPHIGRRERTISAEQEAAIRRQLGFFLGGLTLIPYAICLLLSALAFARGWLNWKTNGGPPALGYFVAMVLDKQIRRYYRGEYGYSLETSPEEDRKAKPASTPRTSASMAFLSWGLRASRQSRSASWSIGSSCESTDP